MRLSVGGKTYSQPIAVKQDPRATASVAALREVYALTDSMYWTLVKLQQAGEEARAVRARMTDSVAAGRVTAILEAPAPPDTSTRGAPPAARATVVGAAAPAPRPAPTTLTGASNALNNLVNSLQGADVPATDTQRAAIREALRNAEIALSRWRSFPR